MPVCYAELHCLTNFTFLRGASHPEELVSRAWELGYPALAITDECSLAGVVRAHAAAGQAHLKLIIGSEFRIENGPRLVLLAQNREGYGNLCGLITASRAAAKKGSYRLEYRHLEGGVPHCLALWLPGDEPDLQAGDRLGNLFPDRLWIAVELLSRSGDSERLAQLQAVGARLSLPCVATGDVHMHAPERQALQDTLTAIRLGVPVSKAGGALQSNGERYLRPMETLQTLYPQSLLEETLRIAQRCDFSLGSLRYEYPREIVPSGETATSHLRKLTQEGLRRRYPGGIPKKVLRQAGKELQLIAELQYEAFFLTVHDVVNYARGQGILCQGRGSAANSIVCYALEITAVGPKHLNMLFGRFISKDRNEPPDIDVDFEHERREEVIQYIYRKYGRERAALAATVITYQARSAFRDVGKALGMNPAQIDRIAKNFAWWEQRDTRIGRLGEGGFDIGSPAVRDLIVLTDMLVGFPRHLSQHVGGFVISQGALSRLVPIENAAMPERTVIQWDKDDLETLGLLKVDVLALGMLTAVSKAIRLVNGIRNTSLTFSGIFAAEKDARQSAPVYQMIQQADTIGVFQIESRAQMSMLPRLKPEDYYDLVIEVAIVRPGPIQGDMVHPYLRRRENPSQVSYPSAALKAVLQRTLGVPIFQEQVMQIAIVAAGFTAGQADQLRRAMAAWRRKGGLEKFEEQLKSGMAKRHYSPEFADQICRQIQGFGEYGFPESHSASFALIVYVSSWLKCHEPAVFTCALLNSQPMGFYAPSQLVQDAQRHGVEVLPVDVLRSEWDCTLESGGQASKARTGAALEPQPALRLGFRMVKGLSEAGAQRLISVRSDRREIEEVLLAARLSQKDLNALANADAFAGVDIDRHGAAWMVSAIRPRPQLLEHALPAEQRIEVPPPSESEQIAADYASLTLTLRRHPLALLRGKLRQLRILTSADLRAVPNGRKVHTAGIVTCRQRPGLARAIFVTLEDETGYTNVVVWERLAEKQRRELLDSSFMGVQGTLERKGDVTHVIADRLVNMSAMLGPLITQSRDFH
jgi:error-prone DNA polymerase